MFLKIDIFCEVGICITVTKVSMFYITVATTTPRVRDNCHEPLELFYALSTS